MAECKACAGTGDGKHVYESCKTCGGRGTVRTALEELEDWGAIREQRENAARVIGMRLMTHLDATFVSLPPTPLCPYRITIEVPRG